MLGEDLSCDGGTETFTVLDTNQSTSSFVFHPFTSSSQLQPMEGRSEIRRMDNCPTSTRYGRAPSTNENRVPTVKIIIRSDRIFHDLTLELTLKEGLTDQLSLSERF